MLLISVIQGLTEAGIALLVCDRAGGRGSGGVLRVPHFFPFIFFQDLVAEHFQWGRSRNEQRNTGHTNPGSILKLGSSFFHVVPAAVLQYEGMLRFMHVVVEDEPLTMLEVVAR